MSMDAAGLPASTSSSSLLNALDSPKRLQEVFAGFSSAGGGAESAGDETEGPQNLALLEKKLLLSAQLGLALLEKQEQLVSDNKALEAKQRELESSVSQLLDRLAQSYKENAQLIKRSERTHANLEASEASNRQLLITLEEERKATRKFNARQSRSLTPSSDPGEVNDLRQELEAERRRANIAEGKARRALSKLAENEQSLNTISLQLEKANESRGRHSVSASRNRSRPSSISLPSPNGLPGQPAEEQVQLLQAIELLKFENESMRGDVQELHALLDGSRDQIARLQAERAEQATNDSFEDNSHEPDQSIANRSGADILRSPGSSSAPSHSTAPTSQAAHDWMPTPVYASSSLMGRLPHSSNEALPIPGPSQIRTHVRRRNMSRQFAVPASRPKNGRAMSVDMSNFMQRKLEDLDTDSYARSPSPRMTSPVLRSFALAGSVNSLSSSLGSPALATAHEDARESEEVEEGPTILEISPSPIKAPPVGESGISLSSPQKRGLNIANVKSSSDEQSRHGSSLLSKDIGVQTIELQSTSMPSTKAAPFAFDKPALQQYSSSIMSSDAASDMDRSDSHPARVIADIDGHRGNRTASLGILVEHVVRLVTRLKAADIVSLEQRLKRQNLPGDVSHLAKATLRDILRDIEAMRNHFRQVLDEETLHLREEAATGNSEASNESLMARKDFVIIVKLFRDVLYELSRLRAIINRIEVEPNLAHRLRDIESIQSPVDLLSTALAGSQDKIGPAALLGPLSRLWYGGDAQQGQTGSKLRPPSADQSRGPTRFAPKLGASSALAAATVNVEFGGQGGIRRQVSIMPQSGDGGLHGRYQSLGKGQAPTAARAPRRELSSIFAGGGGLTANPDPWVVLPSNPTARSRSGAPASRQSVYQPMSQNVNAVIDSVQDDGDFKPNLLERTLRPRGLSDSSIHSTFLAHSNPGGRLVTPAGQAISSTTGGGSHPSKSVYEQTEQTVRGHLSAPAARPSILRQYSSSRNATPVGGASDSNPSSTAGGQVKKADSNMLSPSKSTARLAQSMAVGESVDGNDDHAVNAARSPAGPGGLFANIGAWAARAGGGLTSSYVEPSPLNADKRPNARSASSPAVRKVAKRDPVV